MEPQSSLPYSQAPATCLCPEPTPSSPRNPFPIPQDLYYPPIYVLVSPMVSFPQVSPPKPCAHLSSSSIRATCPAHLILLDFITRTILGEYSELSSSLCNFLQSVAIFSTYLQNESVMQCMFQ